MGKTSRDKRDIFYRLAKESGWRARSAFKLLQIDQEFNIFEGVNRVVDLCAAPGGWTQVLSKKLCSNDDKTKIVAVDLQLMHPLENVIQIKGDITSIITVEKIIKLFEGERADLVVCDGAPDVIGLCEFDEFIQHQLVLSAFKITTKILKFGGTFIAKVFRGKDLSLLYKQLKFFFEEVLITKPRCSRNSSIEAFIFCKNLIQSDKLKDLDKFLNEETKLYYEQIGSDKEQNNIPFKAAIGEFSCYDPDRNYSLDNFNSSTYIYKNPIQMPIKPPYEEANNLRKNNQFNK